MHMRRPPPGTLALFRAGNFTSMGTASSEVCAHLEWARSHVVPSGQQWSLSSQQTAFGDGRDSVKHVVAQTGWETKGLVSAFFRELKLTRQFISTFNNTNTLTREEAHKIITTWAHCITREHKSEKLPSALCVSKLPLPLDSSPMSHQGADSRWCGQDTLMFGLDRERPKQCPQTGPARTHTPTPDRSEV